ncbi:MAG: hypothetical protein ACP5OO_06940 [Chloroflexia bacterium]
MEKKRLEWYASGKERVPGRLLIYTFVTLAAVVFVIALIFTWKWGIGMAILYALAAAAIALVAGLIVWFIYTRLIVKKK